MELEWISSTKFKWNLYGTFAEAMFCVFFPLAFVQDLADIYRPTILSGGQWMKATGGQYLAGGFREVRSAVPQRAPSSGFLTPKWAGARSRLNQSPHTIISPQIK